MNKQWIKQNENRVTKCHLVEHFHFRGGTSEVQGRKVTFPRI